MRLGTLHPQSLLVALAALSTARAPAQTPVLPPLAAPPPSSTALEPEPASAKERLLSSLPEPVSRGLELDAWGWLGYLKNNEAGHSAFWDGELALAITKSFDQTLVVSAQVNFIDANDTRRVDLGTGYLSARLLEDAGTLLTIGKFNANIGVEGRDFWNRTTGTPSLLFGAQPQDIIGAMITQPVGDSGLTLRPFITSDFQGAWYFDQPPSIGLKAQYQATENLRFSLTNLVGPGYVVWGGEPLRPPYPSGGYGASPGAAALNWQGPNLVAERKGTLYFLDLNTVWKPRPDLTVSAEYLLGTTGTSGRRTGWQGWMLLGDYDVTDRLHLFARWSNLDDKDWIITGIFQRRQEVSLGAGYWLIDGVEVRAEYRHDSSNATTDVDMVSFHITFTY